MVASFGKNVLDKVSEPSACRRKVVLRSRWKSFSPFKESVTQNFRGKKTKCYLFEGEQIY